MRAIGIPHSARASRIAGRILLAAALAAAAALPAAGPAQAQRTTASRVDAFKDWSVFTAEQNGPVCWIVSQPQSSKATRGGKPVKVRRGDIYLMVSVRPRQGVAGEASVVSGYPYKKGSSVKVSVGGKKFDFYTEGENAWPSPDDDASLIAAMKKGTVAVVTGVSGRGTVTTDRFSLLGFTAALDSALSRCK